MFNIESRARNSASSCSNKIHDGVSAFEVQLKCYDAASVKGAGLVGGGGLFS